jgi:hypothetical protein
VRSRKFVANPEMLRTFLHLNISDAISDIDVNSNRVTRKEKHVSKREKKKHKFSKVVDSKIREGEAERRKSEVQRFQRQMAQVPLFVSQKKKKNGFPVFSFFSSLEHVLDLFSRFENCIE